MPRHVAKKMRRCEGEASDGETMPHLIIIAAAWIALAVGAAAALAQAPPRAPAASPAAPEAASGFTPKTVAIASRSMVAAAHPAAVDAGLAMLDAGGSAVDAAIAVQLVLNLVEPQSSGIGGGAFLVHYDRVRRAVRTYDGRETAPAAATPTRFLKPDGSPRAFPEAVFGGESVGVPGLVRLLATAHARHGRLPWARLFEPAIALAEAGFPVSPRLNALLAGTAAVNFDAAARAYFFAADGTPHPVGHILKNPAFAETLRALAAGGADAFYTGPIADALVRTVADAPNHKGDLTLADLAAYKVVERPALCVDYRANRVCGMGPPSSGGIAIAQMLKLVEPTTLGRAPLNPDAVHLIAQAQKLAYADRDLYVADPDQVPVPVAGLVDPRYLAARRAWIDPYRAKARADAGDPPRVVRRAGLDETRESVGTSHISIVDAAGNAVSMTTTIENGFGSRLMTGGFLLNNQLTDFSFRPVDAAGLPIANAVAPGKRPRSSMAPTLVLFPDGRVRAVLGSPGGSRIPLYTAKALIGLLDWQLDPQTAVDLPNFGSRNGPLELERGMASLLLKAQMLDRGHEVVDPDMTSGLHVILRRADGTLLGAADPRREGAAKGR
jgi:gamma-glutamyltranspeptidase/glutathione hydrolase